MINTILTHTILSDKDIFFAKLREDAVIPSKRSEDAGYDIYANFKEEFIIILPHDTTIIPTGLCSAFSKKYAAMLKERGSIGSKGIGLRCGIIDSNYRGEWFVALTNHNKYPICIVKDKYKNIRELDGYIKIPYEKAICQCLFIKVPEIEIVEAPIEYVNSIQSERGSGKLGSSKK